MTAKEDRPRRGRVRDRSKDLSVLEATIKLLATDGLAGLSMDRVASLSGVSKVTVYTRWGSKDELIGAALTHLQIDHVPAPTGDLRSDLIAHLRAMRRQYEEVGGMAIIGNCLADEPNSGGLLVKIRQSTLLPRRAHFVAVLREGVERGELRPDLDLEQVTSLLVGCLYADHLAGRPFEATWEADIVDRIMAGIRSPGEQPQDPQDGAM